MNPPGLPSLPPGHILHRGRFLSRYRSPVGNSFWPVLRWKFSRNPKARAKREDPFRVTVRTDVELPPPDRDCLVWLGHASFLLRAAGRTLLLDPCLRGPRFVRRLAFPALDLAGIPVDYVLVSHGHYDHLDLPTLRGLAGSPTALVPLGLGAVVKEAALAVQEAGWYQAYDTGPELKVTLLPAQHWHRRGLSDLNTALWGSFRVDWPGHSLFFAGDTGYNEHFREIRERMGPVDHALLPIGAYDPPYLMRPSHMNPEEALEAFRDLQGRTLIPMHYGTLDLSDEPPGEPLQRLKAAEKGDTVRVLDVGEVLLLG